MGPNVAEQNIFKPTIRGRSNTTSTCDLSEGCGEGDPLLVGYNGNGHRRNQTRRSLSLVSVRDDRRQADCASMGVEAVYGTMQL